MGGLFSFLSQSSSLPPFYPPLLIANLHLLYSAYACYNVKHVNKRKR